MTEFIHPILYVLYGVYGNTVESDSCFVYVSPKIDLMMECRLCLRTEPSVAIFDRANGLPLKIWNCCQIEVDKGDGLPSQICSSCNSKLDSFTDFRITCTEVDGVLKKRLYSNKFESKKEISILKANDTVTVVSPKKRRTRTAKGDSSTRLDKKEESYIGDVVNDIKKEIGHTEIQIEKNLYECGDCGEFLPDERFLRWHIEAFHTMVKIEENHEITNDIEDRDLYDNTCSEDDTLDTNNVDNKSDESYITVANNQSKCNKCSRCYETFQTQHALIKHIICMHLKLINVENHVGAISNDDDKVQVQLKKRPKLRSEDPHACNKCGQILRGKRNLKKHLVSKHLNILLDELEKCDEKEVKLEKKIEEYFCKECGKQLSSKVTLNKHIVSLHPNVMWGLDGDDENGKDDVLLGGILSNAYRQKKRKVQKVPQECDVCGKWLSCKSKLNDHMFTHKRKKGDFSCDLCQRPFKNPCGVRKHKRDFHLKANHYPCNVCGKLYSKHSLANHQKKHFPTTYYKCDYCGKEFKFKNSLLEHIMTHMGMKPNKCTICASAFVSKANLKCHMMQHTGENPFTCDLCPRKFKQRSNLKSHKRHFHKEAI